VLCEGEEIIDYPITVGGTDVEISCVNVGNPHCVIWNRPDLDMF